MVWLLRTFALRKGSKRLLVKTKHHFSENLMDDNVKCLNYQVLFKQVISLHFHEFVMKLQKSSRAKLALLYMSVEKSARTRATKNLIHYDVTYIQRHNQDNVTSSWLYCNNIDGRQRWHNASVLVKSVYQFFAWWQPLGL